MKVAENPKSLYGWETKLSTTFQIGAGVHKGFNKCPLILVQTILGSLLKYFVCIIIINNLSEYKANCILFKELSTADQKKTFKF